MEVIRHTVIRRTIVMYHIIYVLFRTDISTHAPLLFYGKDTQLSPRALSHFSQAKLDSRPQSTRKEWHRELVSSCFRNSGITRLSYYRCSTNYSQKSEKVFTICCLKKNTSKWQKENLSNLSRKGRPRSDKEFLLEKCQEEEEAPYAWHSVGYA
jgi:hypothetical protein